MSRLDAFVAAARERVARGAYATQGEAIAPNGRLQGALANAGAAPPRPDDDPPSVQTGIIAELKPRSPSSGALLRAPAERTLAAYREGGADALSILTDSDFFDGSLGLLRQAHGHGLPTLMKDFVVDDVQIETAAHNGASAVLLIERILGPDAREQLVAAAHGLGLEVLLEVHSRNDWKTARRSEADLIGVNARDLDTLHIDLTAQHALLAQIAGEEQAVVALSGIQRRQDADAAQAAGAAAVLVGTALMRQHDPRLALRALRRPLSKVCGIADDEVLDVALEAGTDMAGFVVLSPESPRDLDVETAHGLAHRAQREHVAAVLVSSCADADALVAAARDLRPDHVQWHAPPGAPVAETRAQLHQAGIGLFIAVAPGGELVASDGVVLDSGVRGGTGHTHDWSTSRRICDAHPGILSLVAGGLDARNAAAALAATGAWGADASSRLESAPGVKDEEKVRAFVHAVHGVR